jgi:hypothetical protein
MSKAAELAALIGSQTAQSNRNLVINGAMQVAQRATSATGLGDGANAFHTVDRIKVAKGSDATAGRFTMTQSDVTDLAGFSNAVKFQCTTTDTSIAASEAMLAQYVFEGQDVQSLMETSTSTKAFTISFYAKANESRAFSVEARTSSGTNRQVAKLFTTSSSWQRFEFPVPAAGSGMQIDNDNSAELTINFWLHAGSTYSGGTLSTDWAGSNNANRAAGIGSLFASTSNFIEITGLQLEAGEVATPFEHRSFDDELQRCQRYYVQLLKADSTKELVIAGGQSGATNFNGFLPYAMRAAPTITWPTSSGVRGEGTTVNISSIAGTMDTNNYVHANATITSGLTANTASFLYAFQGATDLDAEM